MLPARPLLTRRTHWRNRRRVRRRASGRSVYNYFRDYDAVTGRYIESDPIGFNGGLNPYLYANANPLRFADPYGLQAESVLVLSGLGGAGAGAAGAGAGGAGAGAAGAGAAGAAGAGAVGVGAAVTVGAAVGVGIGLGVNEGVERLFGTSVGVLIYEMCNVDSEEARCRKVYKDCAAKCADIFTDDPQSLPGVGSDLAARVRRCIAECVSRAGCSPFVGR